MTREAIVATVNALDTFAGHEEVLKIYNSINPLPRGYRLQEKDPWCAATVSAVFYKNGCATFAECSCCLMIKHAKDAGIWEERDDYIPKPGDVIMYDWQGKAVGDNSGIPDHTGIVTACDGSTATVREGNKAGKVGNRLVKVGQNKAASIRGYIVPKFEEDTAKMDGALWGVFPLLRINSQGKAVAVWQIIADARPDGIFGAETEETTRRFQEEHGLTVDGIVGHETWAAGLQTINIPFF